jgi:hypothetical protein
MSLRAGGWQPWFQVELGTELRNCGMCSVVPGNIYATLSQRPAELTLWQPQMRRRSSSALPGMVQPGPKKGASLAPATRLPRHCRPAAAPGRHQADVQLTSSPGAFRSLERSFPAGARQAMALAWSCLAPRTCRRW